MRLTGHLQNTLIRHRNAVTGNRPKQKQFRGLNCGHQANADVNAAANIRRQGLLPLAKAGSPLGMPPVQRTAKRNTTAPRRKHAACQETPCVSSSEIS